MDNLDEVGTTADPPKICHDSVLSPPTLSQTRPSSWLASAQVRAGINAKNSTSEKLARPIDRVGFVVGKMALGQFFFDYTTWASAFIVPPLLHNHISFIATDAV